MTAVLTQLDLSQLVVGVNVLRNDAEGALGVAAAVGADFIRVNVHIGASVTDQGIIEGKAAETLRLRHSLAPGVGILADVDCKHARPLGERPALSELAAETVGRGLADGLIVSGSGTGAPTSSDHLEEVRLAAPDALMLVGSGATPQTIQGLLRHADGAIVGTSIKEGGASRAPVNLERARSFVRQARVS